MAAPSPTECRLGSATRSSAVDAGSSRRDDGQQPCTLSMVYEAEAQLLASLSWKVAGRTLDDALWQAAAEMHPSQEQAAAAAYLLDLALHDLPLLHECDPLELARAAVSAAQGPLDAPPEPAEEAACGVSQRESLPHVLVALHARTRPPFLRSRLTACHDRHLGIAIPTRRRSERIRSHLH